MLYRKIENVISSHLKADAKRILLVDGARQVGKTYIIRHVGKSLFANFIEINMVEDALGDSLFANVKTVEDFLDSIENQCLYQILIKVDRLTLQIALMKIQGYSTREIAVYLDITEKAVYRRMDRLKEKLKKFFE